MDKFVEAFSTESACNRMRVKCFTADTESVAWAAGKLLLTKDES